MIPKSPIASWTAAFISGAAVFAFDQWLKASLFDGLTYEGEAFSFANGLIRSTLHHNYGISFNIPIPQVVIVLITGIALGWAVALLIERTRASQLAACILIGIFIGGTLGNAFDRLTLGFVRDWMLLFGRSAINFADVCIGGSLLAYLWNASRAKS